MTEAEVIQKIARKLMVRDGLNDDWYYDCRGSTKDISIGETVIRYEVEAEQFIADLKEAGYRPMPELKALTPEALKKRGSKLE